METLLLNKNKIIKYEFINFISYYNCNNGRIMNIPSEYEEYYDEYCKINDFYGIPNKAIDNSVVIICINLTTKCNLRCKYCFNDKSNFIDLDINKAFDFIDLIIEKNKNASKFFVDLSGSGEPLLAFDNIIKIANYCLKKSDEIAKDVIPQLVCNGTLLNSRIVDELQKNRVLFGISIDGYKNLHDKNRVDIFGNGTFDKIIKNAWNIQHREFVGVAMTVSDEETDIFKAYMELERIFETISIRFARQDYYNFNFDYIIDGYKKVCSYIIENYKENNLNFICKIINGDDFFGKCLLKIMSNTYMEHRCDAGKSRFALGADGNIYPCSAMVFDNSKIIKDSKNIQIDNCENCYLKHFCGGLCPLQMKYSSNNLCDFKKKIFEMSLELLGNMQILNMDLYYEFLDKARLVLERNFIDSELLEKYKKNENSISYTKLKELKDNNRMEYDKL